MIKNILQPIISHLRFLGPDLLTCIGLLVDILLISIDPDGIWLYVGLDITTSFLGQVSWSLFLSTVGIGARFWLICGVNSGNFTSSFQLGFFCSLDASTDLASTETVFVDLISVVWGATGACAGVPKSICGIVFVIVNLFSAIVVCVEIGSVLAIGTWFTFSVCSWICGETGISGAETTEGTTAEVWTDSVLTTGVWFTSGLTDEGVETAEDDTTPPILKVSFEAWAWLEIGCELELVRSIFFVFQILASDAFVVSALVSKFGCKVGSGATFEFPLTAEFGAVVGFATVGDVWSFVLALHPAPLEFPGENKFHREFVSII